jgi:antibiotic biosynthesis monooxygenase (ABM) superfamily enzyme
MTKRLTDDEKEARHDAKDAAEAKEEAEAVVARTPAPPPFLGSVETLPSAHDRVAATMARHNQARDVKAWLDAETKFNADLTVWLEAEEHSHESE